MENTKLQGVFSSNFRLVFFPQITVSVKAKSNGGILEVALDFEEEGQPQYVAKAAYTECPQWTLSVAKASTGQSMFSGKMNEPTANINTSSWTPGVYIISAQIGNEVHNEKIVIR